ncbi:MAG: PGF-pre-PGF domain-containing protein [ANME-2 cluster archaeon]|nr:PGF-pre-PGF domain-containing protein [ANME-2 cluster archaeon]
MGAFESNERLVAFSQSVVNIYTPATPPPSGGGIGTSGEAFENIVCSETDRQFIGKDEEVSFSFELECNYVKYVNFTGLMSFGKEASKVEILNHTSTLVSKDTPDVVLKNLNVWVGGLGMFSENNIRDPSITSMVDRSWVVDNGIILNTISFYSYNDNTKD